MQTLHPTTDRSSERRELTRLADEFSEHWNEITRFLLNTKRRAAMYAGPEAELSHGQLAALTALANGDMRMTDLASQVDLAESTATRLVDRLAGLGLVERRAETHDRRSVVAGLTEEGRVLMKRVRAARRDFLKEILQTLGPEERADMVRLFGRVADQLRSRGAAPATEVRS